MSFDPANLKDIVDFMARVLVDEPDQVQVTEVEGDKTTVFELAVADGDRGKVIGRKGDTAKAMRKILSAASGKTGKRTHLEIME